MYPQVFKSLWEKEPLKDHEGNVIGAQTDEKEFKIRYHCNIIPSMSEEHG